MDVTAGDALSRLVEGNARFASGQTSWKDPAAKLPTLVAGQHPFATVLCCSDSRVPPEVVFDQGLGDLFVVRTAGHVVDDAALGSVECGALHCGTPLVLVLGHTRCGAATMACESGACADDEKGEGYHLEAVVSAFRAALELVETRRPEARGTTKVYHVAKAHVELTKSRLLQASRPLFKASRAGRMRVAGAIFHLETGRVEFLNQLGSNDA
ncbi:MAG: carbonic anhydrase [Promethearchaeota archaeon]